MSINEFGNAATLPPVTDCPRVPLHLAETHGLEDVPLYVRNVAALRGLGFSFREIGKSYGVTPQAVSIMLTRQRAVMKSLKRPSDHGNLSPRAVNSLGRLGIHTRDDARATPNLEEQLRIQRNCGPKTIREILDWTTA
jgi:hypothetical protein